jgi:hypothetical protein
MELRLELPLCRIYSIIHYKGKRENDYDITDGEVEYKSESKNWETIAVMKFRFYF